SRRRHTRSYGDWSSDVCSSDLFVVCTVLFNTSSPVRLIYAKEYTRRCVRRSERGARAATPGRAILPPMIQPRRAILALSLLLLRSEERRVGKACRSRWSA